MTAATSDWPSAEILTTDDLEKFPEDNVRRELLDGVLLVSPSPTSTHQIIAARLMVALEEDCPSDKAVTQNVDVYFSKLRSFAPDVLVITSTAARRTERPFMSHEVVLAVEIVSPTSVGMDRVAKPAFYAGAGIPYYWRVETDGGIVVHTYKIDPVHETYQATGAFSDVIETDEPWPITLPIRRLTPRLFPGS
jgi:Uma2 family endonuclease